ncbi:MAG: DUF1844 domain-containing protein [Candidatus Heimdallarchaeota archaeon]
MGENEQTAEKEKVKAVDISMLDTYTLLGLFINLLSVQAWRDMGLRTDPKTNEIKTDFERASVAIDCIRYLLDKLEPQLNQNERFRLKSLLTDLQVNFVQQSEQQKQTNPGNS